MTISVNISKVALLVMLIQLGFDGYVMTAERLTVLNTPCMTFGITDNVKQLGSFKTESVILTRIVLEHSLNRTSKC